MRHASLQAFLSRHRGVLARGPVAILLAEDGVELASSIRHALDKGFRAVVLVADPALPLPPEAEEPRVHVAAHPLLAEGAAVEAVNACLRAARPGTWMSYFFNAEYLFFPFCESRSVAEMCAFAESERREAVLTYVVDLYAGDLDRHPTAVSLDDAHLDRSGYYALQRVDRRGHPLERQLDFFGGLRWRFEEHVPPARRRIDRVGVVRAAPGLELRPDHTFNRPEHNTYACPWHHSLTAALCSFRVAKALKRNPGSSFEIRTFRWHNSAPFAWHSQQLLDLGLMEPGQWF
jgi:hypothetical protein